MNMADSLVAGPEMTIVFIITGIPHKITPTIRFIFSLIFMTVSFILLSFPVAGLSRQILRVREHIAAMPA
jgi:hypothetical protein